jgi:molecular chaperone Hsp33
MTETARLAHSLSPVATAALGRTLCGGAMMGVMMKGDKDLLTIQILGDGPIGGITVTADAHGHVKGYVNEAGVMLPATPNGKLDVGGAVGSGTLRIVQDLGLKEPYIGQVPLQTGEIAEDLTYYFAYSEQVPSSVGLGVLLNKDQTVRQAGGFLIQLMPYCDEDAIRRLEQNVANASSVTSMLEAGHSPEDILRILLDGLEITFNDRISTGFVCDCSKERVERALVSIGKEECAQILEEGKDVEINCRFCGKTYTIGMEELKSICNTAF